MTPFGRRFEFPGLGKGVQAKRGKERQDTHSHSQRVLGLYRATWHDLYETSYDARCPL